MRITIGALGLLGLACASGPTSSAMFEYGPAAAPLRYAVTSHRSVKVETPMGDQQSSDTTEATVTISLGEPADVGRHVTASFEAFSSRVGGAMGARSLDGEGLIGEPLSGILRPTGRIDIDTRPTLPEALAETFDPASFFTDLLAPMPPDGETGAPWPVRFEVTSATAMHVTGTYDGMARLAGDTAWNGTPAKIILSEGKIEIRGSGTPSGAPAELSMKMAGTSTRRYVWDAARGVLLAGWSVDRATGSIELQGMGLTLPATTELIQGIEIKP